MLFLKNSVREALLLLAIFKQAALNLSNKKSYLLEIVQEGKDFGGLIESADKIIQS